MKSVRHIKPYPKQGKQSNGKARGERERPQWDPRRVNEREWKKRF